MRLDSVGSCCTLPISAMPGMAAGCAKVVSSEWQVFLFWPQVQLIPGVHLADLSHSVSYDTVNTGGKEPPTVRAPHPVPTSLPPCHS